MPVRVLVAATTYLEQEGIARALGQVDGVEVVGLFEGHASMHEAIEATQPDVVLAGTPAGGLDAGIRLAASLRESDPEVAVLVLGDDVDPRSAAELFGDGPDGRGVLLKDRLHSADELGRAVKDVAARGAYIDSVVAASLLAEPRDWQLHRLTRREAEILAMIAEGRSNSAIAAATGISKRAVERHVNAIFAKLELPVDDETNRRVKAALLFRAAGGGLARSG